MPLISLISPKAKAWEESSRKSCLSSGTLWLSHTVFFSILTMRIFGDLFELRLFGSERSKSLSNVQEERYILEYPCHWDQRARGPAAMQEISSSWTLCGGHRASTSPAEPSILLSLQRLYHCALSVVTKAPLAPTLPCELSVSTLPILGVISPPYSF